MSVWSRFANLWRSQSLDHELDEELRFHREMHVERSLARGLTREEAEAAARRHLGSTLRATEGMRQARVMVWLESLAADIRYGARLLRRRAGLAALATMTLSLGIGANTAIFTLLNAILLRPMPFEDPDRLVVVLDRFSRLGITATPPTIPEILDLSARNHVLSNIAFFDTRDFRISGGDEPARVFTARVSASLFPALGVRPALGRLFVDVDNTQGHWNVVVLSDGLWRRNFGGDPSVVGRTLSVNGAPHAIVGVLPRGFAMNYPGIANSEPIEMYVPFTLYEQYTSRAADFVNVRRVTTIARLRPEVTRGQASAELNEIARQLAAEHPDLYRRAGTDTGFRLDVEGLHDMVSRSARGALTLLLGAVLLVLLIACVNTGQFLLAQSLDRESEVAVRTALGASRGRLFRQFLIESSLLAFVGAVLGLLQALWLVQAMLAFVPGHRPEFDTLGVDRTVLAFNVGLALASSIVVGVLPAFYFARANPGRRLASRGGTSRYRARHVLVGLEVALAVVLLVAAGFLIQGSWRLQNSNRGFAPDHVTAMQVRGQGSQATRPIASVVYQHYVEHLSAMRGVEAAGVATALPLRNFPGTDYAVEGQTRDPADTARQLASYQIVSSGYFRVFRIPLLEGRTIADDDVVERQRVAVVNEAFVRRHFPTESALGHQLRVAGPDLLTIVGVVGNVQATALETTPAPQIYVSNLQRYEPNMNLVVRMAPGAPLTADAIKKAISAVTPDVPVFNIQPMSELIRATVSDQRFIAMLLGSFAVLALVMSAAGVYLIVWYLVTTRTREIAVRLAVGARARDIVRLVSGQTLGWTLAGLAVGVVLAVAASGVTRAVALGVGRLEPLTVVGLVGFYLLVAVAAMWAPVARVLRFIDPAAALRAE